MFRDLDAFTPFTSLAANSGASPARQTVLYFKVSIGPHEMGLHFRNGDFLRPLAPGKYRLWSRWWAPGRDRVEVVDTRTIRFEHPLLDRLVAEASLRGALEVVEVRQDQRALVWKDEKLDQIVGPGRHAFWKTPHALRVELINIQGVTPSRRSVVEALAGQSAAFR